MTNVVVNGDFSTGSIPPWLQYNVSGGVPTVVNLPGKGNVVHCPFTSTYPSTGIYQYITNGASYAGQTYSYGFSAMTTTPNTSITSYVFEVADPINPTATFVDNIPSDGLWHYFNHHGTFTSGISDIDIVNFQNTPFVNGGYYMDNITIITPVLCMAGFSMVKTQGDVYVRADELVAGKHQVFDVDAKEYIDIIHVIETGPTKKIMKISKNLLGENVPNDDLFLTTGHRIVVDNQPIRARDVPGAVYTGILMPVYTLVCPRKCAIDVNGAPVMVFEIEEWNSKYKNVVLNR